MQLRARRDDFVEGRAFEFEAFEELLVATRADEVPDLLERAERAVRSGSYAVGFVGYEAAPGFDVALRVRAADEPSSLPLACFALFRSVRETALVEPPESIPTGSWVEESNADEHEKAITLIKERIDAGWTYQVNLTTRLVRGYDEDPFLLYRQLASAQRGAYNTYLECEDWAVASASPELFFRFADGMVTTRPMKGTARRGRFAAEDEQAADYLLNSPKERAENVMIVDLIRNDLGRIARYGSVSVPKLLTLERYPTVWQLTSEVEAQATSGVGVAEVFSALFPCGSVTGAPKSSTMRIISELETSPRGVYCGAIGSIEPSASGPVASFAVAIRTASVDRQRARATYGVGGGITFDSDPAGEWAEVQAKARVLVARPRRFGLIETFRYEDASGFVDLDRHLDRLARSATYFDFSFDRPRVLELLANRVAELPNPARIRLTLGASGEVEILAEPLALPDDQPLVLGVDDLAVIDPTDERLFHKTTDRRIFEDAIARHPGVDDLVLLNTAGELTETTRANLAVQLDGQWWTPSLRCGLLPGIRRARLLQAGVLHERVLRPSDLERASALATMSSLRGWHLARLATEDDPPEEPETR